MKTPTALMLGTTSLTGGAVLAFVMSGPPGHEVEKPVLPVLQPLPEAAAPDVTPTPSKLRVRRRDIKTYNVRGTVVVADRAGKLYLVSPSALVPKTDDYFEIDATLLIPITEEAFRSINELPSHRSDFMLLQKPEELR